MNKITYHKEGDYWIPDIIVENCRKDYHIGKYGHLRLKYIKEHKRGLYTELLITGKLPEHIVDVDINANKKVQSIIKELAKKENIDENLKQNNQMEWVRSMNNIKNRAEEIVFNELIYI